jgi:hypothetical protein
MHIIIAAIYIARKKLTFALHPSLIIFFQENSHRNFLIALTPRGTSHQFMIIFKRIC